MREIIGRQADGCLEKEIQTPMGQGRSTNVISMIKWIRTSRLSIKNSLSLRVIHLVRSTCHAMSGQR